MTVAACVLAGGLAVSSPALAAGEERAEAKIHYDRATAAYALGRYADAAAEFEQAFSLKPDPAILYNAAQAYRLAGKIERALELYRNYRRVYGRRGEHAQDVDKHVAELEKALESNRRASSAEETGLANIEGGSAPAETPRPMPPPVLTVAAPAATPAAPAGAAPTLIAQPAPPEKERPVYTRWWFWAGAGAVVAGVVVGALLLSSRNATDCGPGLDYCANTGL